MTFWEPPPLEMFRANAARNGYYPTRGVHSPGGLKWKFRTRGAVMSSPVVVAEPIGLVCFGSWDGAFYALDARSGAMKWKFTAGGGIVSSPAVDSTAAYFGSYDGYIYAMHLETGKELWRFKTTNAVASSPLVTRLFFPAGVYSSFPMVRSLYLTFGSNDCSLYVLDTRGRLQSRFETRQPIVSSPAGPVAASAAALAPESPETAVVAAGSRDGSLYAVDIKTGVEKWHFDT
ncbi:MAG: PQQ-binding-like beta-propeller repeat protein, partial [Desulfomonile sp.]|nr:PQQ-binding-like beta-propeller repeat protein [Desulfomonile sp.]